VSLQFNAPDPHDPIIQFKFRIVEILGLIFFLILVTDTAVTELTPIVKHIWHTLNGP
jgi:hypothetical protein